MLTKDEHCRILNLQDEESRKEGDFMEDDKVQQMNNVYNKLSDQNKDMLLLLAKGMEVAQNQQKVS